MKIFLKIKLKKKYLFVLKLVKKNLMKLLQNSSINFVLFNLSQKQLIFKSRFASNLVNKKFDKMIRVRLNEKEKRLAISLKCKIYENVEKEINLNRSYDESLASTFERLYSTFSKHCSGGKSKKLKKDSESLIESVKEEIPIFLFDNENQSVPTETKNIDAWKENYSFRLKNQEFKVVLNLPCVKKFNLTKILIAGMPALVKCEFEGDTSTHELLERNSLFKWYISDTVYEPVDLTELESDKKSKNKSINLDKIKWSLIDEGVSKPMINLDEEFENRLIKVECYPNDGTREGIAVETVSVSPVLKQIDRTKLPMTERHLYTQNRLDTNSLVIF